MEIGQEEQQNETDRNNQHVDEIFHPRENRQYIETASFIKRGEYLNSKKEPFVF